jgi:hypothetical protein
LQIVQGANLKFVLIPKLNFILDKSVLTYFAIIYFTLHFIMEIKENEKTFFSPIFHCIPDGLPDVFGRSVVQKFEFENGIKGRREEPHQ